MSKKNFANAIFGFKKTEVFEYISDFNSEAESKIGQKNAEIKELKKLSDSLFAEKEELCAEICKMEEELSEFSAMKEEFVALKEELAALSEELETAKASLQKQDNAESASNKKDLAETASKKAEEIKAVAIAKIKAKEPELRKVAAAKRAPAQGEMLENLKKLFNNLQLKMKAALEENLR